MIKINKKNIQAHVVQWNYYATLKKCFIYIIANSFLENPPTVTEYIGIKDCIDYNVQETKSRT